LQHLDERTNGPLFRNQLLVLVIAAHKDNKSQISAFLTWPLHMSLQFKSAVAAQIQVDALNSSMCLGLAKKKGFIL
jgi:hypothetical protein